VLNAFRHHGVSRPQLPDDYDTAAECSTPFGITEFRGAIVEVGWGGFNRCSTPFGITEFRGLLVKAKHHPPRVLNAFRHHGVSRS